MEDASFPFGEISMDWVERACWEVIGVRLFNH